MTTLRNKVSVVIRRPVDEVFAAYCAGRFGTVKDTQLERIIVPADAPLRQGISIWERGIDEHGYSVESNVSVTDYLAPFRIAFRSESAFSKKQPNKQLSSAALARKSYTSRVCTFEPAGSGTRFTIEEEYSFPLPRVYWLVLPLRRSSRRESLARSMYRMKDAQERMAGLQVSRFHFRPRKSWIAWSVYLLVMILLFWVYSARNEIELPPNISGLLLIALSALFAIGFILILAINVYFRRE